jgi:hypothetical protein
MKFKNFKRCFVRQLLTKVMVYSTLRAALQIFFQSIRFFKAQKDVDSGAISASKVVAQGGCPPFIWVGVRDGNVYHKKVNESLILENKILWFRPTISCPKMS